MYIACYGVRIPNNLMMNIILIIIIVAIALPSLNRKINPIRNPIKVARSSLAILSAAVSLTAVYIQSIGSGWGTKCSAGFVYYIKNFAKYISVAVVWLATVYIQSIG